LYNKYIKEILMATDLRVGFITGSGAILDTVSSVTVANTRIRDIHYTGSGTFVIEGVDVDNEGNTKGSNIKFVGTTNKDAGNLDLSDNGVRMYGPVKVSAPTSSATITVFYG